MQLAGFRVGQVVRHKIDGRRVVIISFWQDEDGPYAVAAFSSWPGAMGDFYIAEIEAVVEEKQADTTTDAQADPAVAGDSRVDAASPVRA